MRTYPPESLAPYFSQVECRVDVADVARGWHFLCGPEVKAQTVDNSSKKSQISGRPYTILRIFYKHSLDPKLLKVLHIVGDG